MQSPRPAPGEQRAPRAPSGCTSTASVEALAAAARIDAGRIRRTYTAVLGETRVGLPNLGSEEQRAHFAGLLRGQLQLLLGDLKGRTSGMSGETRHTAEYVARRACEALAVGLAEARDPYHLYDLAVLSRSLLTLHELTRPTPKLRPLPDSCEPVASTPQTPVPYWPP